VTRSQNIQHSYATNKARASSAERRSKPILGRKKRASVGTTEEDKSGGGKWVRYASISAAAKELPGLKPGSISRCCHGKCKQTGGYQFRFDAESAAPEVLEGEEWRDVVLTDDDD
jgi:hypothetical protein